MQSSSEPTGLYDERFEHDACGVGLVCNINGRPDHLTVCRGLDMLVNLTHRGACGSDPETGDGAGITVQIPDKFLRTVCANMNFRLPATGAYGVAMLFLPPDPAKAEVIRQEFDSVIRDENQIPLGWRQVPVESSSIGVTARHSEPGIWQCFIERDRGVSAGREFERHLFIIRKVAERRFTELTPDRHLRPYIVSCSSQTIIYKGMLKTDQLGTYFPDLRDNRLESAVAIVHSRFSTNTLPRWSLAHPFRVLAHNGEINTLRGNVNWMRARESLIESTLFGEHLRKVFPVLETDASDSAALDNALEFLYHAGRSLPHAMMMLIPEAWEHDPTMPEWKRNFYAFHACLMEPWDGPAAVLFTDGRYAGAVLDRNGLRPSRYTVTHDGMLVLSSETGVLSIDPANEKEKGRIYPGHMFLVDLSEGRIVGDDEVKTILASKQPYGSWLADRMRTVHDIPLATPVPPLSDSDLVTKHRLFGYTDEDIRTLVHPMVDTGKEAIGSMGADFPHAVLSSRRRPLFDYFKQLFAQVTNPPLDAIRERIVTSLYTYLGANRNPLTESEDHADMLRLDQPILDNAQLAGLLKLEDVYRIDTLFPVDDPDLDRAINTLCEEAEHAVETGKSILILSDRRANATFAPLPSLLASASLHHHLIRTGHRLSCSIVVESGEPREVHHFCCLVGFGADAINPYIALDTAIVLHSRNQTIDTATGVKNYIHAIDEGILKVMSKMGISTLQSYRGAQIFEAVGIHADVITRHFTGTPSRIGGIGLEIISKEVLLAHECAFPKSLIPGDIPLEPGGKYQWRRNGEEHAFNPESISALQQAVRTNDQRSYSEFADQINSRVLNPSTLRDLIEIDFDSRTPIPVDEVEPWTDIVTRFKTGAMSYGSISQESHETLARAMNHLGGKSNTGEGGEDPERFPTISPIRSRIKQIASGRFGVSIAYLASADEIQIKMAQGAKPGEGGQLPGEKVYPWIARTRHSTPYVGLISPPPHHDIYSIEDLAQLIHDLKHANPTARISVKLVSEVGVGTISAGVVKAGADLILISGFDGGTGAAPKTSSQHTGLPWELGLAETQQTLIQNGLRNRVHIECDGQLKTGRDVVMAALLGAEEFGFATAPLVALGCIVMRKCHLNTCPVGIATQNPVLRNHFSGQAEYVVNYFHFVAEELRGLMARLGFRTIEEMSGRVDVLRQRSDINHWKARHVSLDALLKRPTPPSHSYVDTAANEASSNTTSNNTGIGSSLDRHLIQETQPSLLRAEPVEVDVTVDNGNRAFGTMLSHTVVKKFGPNGLPEGLIKIRATGTGGQSFGAFVSKGISIFLSGDANDYFGKGLSGGTLVLRPPKNVGFRPHDNIIVGNVGLYGAISGNVYIRGRAGERFGVRNSGATAVVEGVGDHGCEYMTGGCVVILGMTGRNFAAGMSGGIAFVMDGTWDFRTGRCNTSSVDIERVTSSEDIHLLHRLIEQHHTLTESSVAAWALEHWERARYEFVKVMPIEYRKALARLSKRGSPSAHSPDARISPDHVTPRSFARANSRF